MQTRWNIFRTFQLAFLEWFPYLAEIGQRCRASIVATIGPADMATGPSKMIDNAIIGFMLAKDTAQRVTDTPTA